MGHVPGHEQRAASTRVVGEATEPVRIRVQLFSSERERRPSVRCSDCARDAAKPESPSTSITNSRDDTPGNELVGRLPPGAQSCGMKVREIIRVLELDGWHLVRIRGSHHHCNPVSETESESGGLR